MMMQTVWLLVFDWQMNSWIPNVCPDGIYVSDDACACFFLLLYGFDIAPVKINSDFTSFICLLCTDTKGLVPRKQTSFKETYYSHFQVHNCVLGYDSDLILKTQQPISCLILSSSAALCCPLCLKHSVLDPVSLKPPPPPAALIGQLTHAWAGNAYNRAAVLNQFLSAKLAVMHKLCKYVMTQSHRNKGGTTDDVIQEQF